MISVVARPYILIALLPSMAWQGVECLAQVVQLPSYRSFSYGGSALVPDGGTSSLGGTRYSTSTSTRSGWGPYSNRAVSGNAGGTSLSAAVQIIDLDALDAAILSSANRTPRATQPTASVRASSALLASRANELDKGNKADLDTKKSATYLAENVSQRAGADPGHWQRALAGGADGRVNNFSTLENDIRYYLVKGRDAENAGSPLAARVYYKMARDAMSPELTNRYLQIVAEREAAEEARIKAEIEAGRRSF